MCAMKTALLLLLSVAAAVLYGIEVEAVNALASGNMLRVYDYLYEGSYMLVMQEDCNLVVYAGVTDPNDPTWSNAIWSSGSAGQGANCVAKMQEDANFVVYDAPEGGTPVWWANHMSYDPGAYYVILQDDGTLSIRQIGTDQVVWGSSNSPRALAPSPAQSPLTLAPNSALRPQTVTGVEYMLAGYVLLAGSSLQNGDYSLTLGLDCNLRSKDRRGRVLWETGTEGLGSGCELRLQEDGVLQISDGNGVLVWGSNFTGNASTDAFYVLFLDGKTGIVKVFEDHQLERAVWTSPVSYASGKRHSSVVGLVLGIIGGLVGAGIVIAGVLFALTQYGYFDRSEKELQQRLQSGAGRSRAMSFAQIRKATKNFEKKIGEGGFGPVYYGKLPDGQEVAVKVLSATSSQGKQEFFNEIELLTMVHHKYLVSLVGYCIAWKEKYLVYQYLSGSDLRERLHGESAERTPLSWRERTTVIMQVAEGLEYLHNGCRIIHRDVKSNNILLTEKMVAKVADFGLSKLVATDEDGATHITTAVKGTTGYLDPEYYVTHKLTEKSDVYAFGVLMMEIITGRDLIDKQDQQFIVHVVRRAWKSKVLEELVDPHLAGAYDSTEFSDLVKLSLWCVKQSMMNRPSMAEVVQELRSLMVVEGPHIDDESVVALPYGIDFPSSYTLDMMGSGFIGNTVCSSGSDSTRTLLQKGEEAVNEASTGRS